MGTESEYSDLSSDQKMIVPFGYSMTRIGGADRREWLQGQTTQDMRGLQPGDTVGLVFASMTGQCEALGWLTAGEDEDGFWCEAAALSVIQKRVADFVILEDVSIDIGRRYHYYYFHGAVPQAMGGADIEPHLFADSDDPQRFSLTPDLVCAHVGIPTFADYSGRILVPELGTTMMDLFAANEKGCYVGQEVIHRVAARGRVKRRWEVLSIDGEPPPLGKSDFGEVLRVFEFDSDSGHQAFATSLIRTEFNDQLRFDWEGGHGFRTIRTKGVSA